MFQGLQQGMTIFVLYKNEPRVEEARVVTVNTHPSLPNPSNPMAILNGPVTDLTVSVDGKMLPPFQGLSPSAMSATFSAEGMFISEDKGLVLNEINSIRESHQRIVDGYKPSKEMVAKCDALYLSLNPEKQKEIQNAKEMADLRSELTELKNMLAVALGTKPRNKKEE